MIVPRLLSRSIRAALADTPVILVAGARQVGKTTLVRQIVSGGRYLSLDDPALRDAARSDALGFLDREVGGTLVIDEVQRAPELLQAIKLVVDRDRRPGTFVLTGSANVFAIPRVSESLAGRMETLVLRPFAQLEVAGGDLDAETFVDRIFAPKLPWWTRSEGRSKIFDRMLEGGYPESRLRSPRRRDAWFRAYVDGVLQREVREIANVASLDRLGRLLSLLAQRSAQPLNTSRVSSDLGLAWNTVDSYLALLRATFLIAEVRAWSRSTNARITRQTKVLVGDSGLSASLMGLTAERLLEPNAALGPLVETFVGNELLRLRGAATIDCELLYYRTQRGEEVDFVLERRGGGVVGIEVKASTNVSLGDFRGIDALRRDAGDAFHRGIILYTGEATASFGDGRFAVPISALWDDPV